MNILFKFKHLTLELEILFHYNFITKIYQELNPAVRFIFLPVTPSAAEGFFLRQKGYRFPSGLGFSSKSNPRKSANQYNPCSNANTIIFHLRRISRFRKNLRARKRISQNNPDVQQKRRLQEYSRHHFHEQSRSRNEVENCRQFIRICQGRTV